MTIVVIVCQFDISIEQWWDGALVGGCLDSLKHALSV